MSIGCCVIIRSKPSQRCEPFLVNIIKRKSKQLLTDKIGEKLNCESFELNVFTIQLDEDYRLAINKLGSYIFKPKFIQLFSIYYGMSANYYLHQRPNLDEGIFSD